jgi:hypothetical protein
MSSPEVSRAVRIPADVDREDRVLANLTARQVALLAVGGLLLYALYAATRLVLPLVAFAVFAVPVSVAVAVLVLGVRDGMSLDRFALAALTQRLSPRLQVAAPEGVPAAPDWLLARSVSAHDATQRLTPTALHLPARAITDAAASGSPADVGLIDLGADGLAVVCACSTVNFALRTPSEQEALVACFGRYLHGLSAPVQILIRAERLDLADQITTLRQRAAGLPHPALESASLAHADYLENLATGTDLLRRQVLLILREPIGSAASSHRPFLLRRARNQPRGGSWAEYERAAHTRLGGRVAETIALLAPAGIVVTALDSGQATAVLAAACNPEALIAPTAVLAGADDIITTPSDFHDAGDAYPPPEGDATTAPGQAEEQMWWTR